MWERWSMKPAYQLLRTLTQSIKSLLPSPGISSSITLHRIESCKNTVCLNCLKITFEHTNSACCWWAGSEAPVPPVLHPLCFPLYLLWVCQHVHKAESRKWSRGLGVYKSLSQIQQVIIMPLNSLGQLSLGRFIHRGKRKYFAWACKGFCVIVTAH